MKMTITKITITEIKYCERCKYLDYYYGGDGHCSKRHIRLPDTLKMECSYFKYDYQFIIEKNITLKKKVNKLLNDFYNE